MALSAVRSKTTSSCYMVSKKNTISCSLALNMNKSFSKMHFKAQNDRSVPSIGGAL